MGQQIASKAQLRMAFLRWALVLVPLILLLGMGSGLLANSGPQNSWYQLLVKPAIMPPAPLFGIVWPILYVLMGLALTFVVVARRARGREVAIAVFVVQLVLNLIWSPLFFGLHQVSMALTLIAILLLAVAATVVLFWRVRTVAGLLLLPYLGWIAFATVLNYQYDILNPDAETLAPAGSRTQISL